MINWNIIKAKYPKAFQLLCNYHENEVVGLIDHPDVWDLEKLSPSNWELRHLYDFFDENGIYLQVIVKCALDNSVWFLGYIWSIEPDIDEYMELEKQSRTVVEHTTFIKAFEILEKKL